MKIRILRRSIALLCVVLILLVVMALCITKILNGIAPRGTTPATDYASKTIIRDGVPYFPRQDITVMLVMGIDRFGAVEESEYSSNKGDADMVSLLVFDEQDETIDILVLNRDTMVKMPVLGLGGKPAGSRYAQLTLAHTYGSGLRDSCENVKKTVSDLFNGLRIDYYLSMNMDAISLLNDAVGGVTVNVTEDFSAVDPTISVGEQTLNGEQAINYVRTRKDVGDQLNTSRMERQRKYMEGFVNAVWASLDESETFIYSVYEDVDDYIVTDCTLASLGSLFSRYQDYTLQEVITLKGESVLNDGYMEFHVDEDALDDVMLDLFYSEKM